jgi:hypothetical protein
MTRRNVLILGSVCTAVAAVLGTGAAWIDRYHTSPASGPSDPIVVLGPSWVEIDKADRITPSEAVFTVKNAGPTDVAILGAESNCSCSRVSLDRSHLRPGETMAVRLTVTTFDVQKSHYSQSIRLRTDAGAVVLGIRGRLPKPRTVLYRPTELVLQRSRNRTEWRDNSREVVLRVPTHCAADFGAATCSTELSNLVFEVSETGNTDADAREVRVRVRTTAGATCGTSAATSHIWLATGCDRVVIPVKFDDD